jgi:hypothetical protein
MIPRQTFIDMIGEYRLLTLHRHAAERALSLADPDFTHHLPVGRYEALFLKSLIHGIGDDPDDSLVEWWMFDREFGAADCKITSSTVIADLSEAGALYDYITAKK